MEIYGGMQCMILSKKILERSIEGMRKTKGCMCIEYPKWKRLYHHFNMNL
jgi:hypothetical protein